MKMNLRMVEGFRAVMTLGTVTAAAQALGTSQPALSRSIQQLESAVGFRLFERVRSRLQPTAYATALFDEVQKTFLGLDHISHVATSLRTFQRGSISVVCAPVFSGGFIAEVSTRFLARYSNVSLSIDTQLSPAVVDRLGTQRADLGLTGYAVSPPGALWSTFAEPDEVCALPPRHPLAAKAVVHPEDFDGSSFVHVGGNDPYRFRLDKVFDDAGVRRRLVVETLNSATACAMVVKGAGVTIVNPFSAVDFLDRGLVIRRFSPRLPFATTLLRARHRPSSPLVDLFIEQLTETRDSYIAAAQAALSAGVSDPGK